ncbi:lactate utilization protein C [Neobacillus notoginsengisoli]|uniref:Lactate utilization protein C n=1 Tax=Neobacillus notoginsengisoli TaxID=1578198 RepID=A0A417YFH5_9BACI|nr:lactate utilization protein C [Neobacillus notoginsengisoli]RHW31425.1 lactate utilization protein C [Neobacillus notoginsengisoli]
MQGTIHNRNKFLDKIASQLGRPRRTAGVSRPEYHFQPQHEIYKGASQDELLEILKTQCLKIHTTLYETDLAGLPSKVKEIAAEFGGGPVITWDDERYAKWGLGSLLKEEWPSENVEVRVWDHLKGDENIPLAENAKIGLTISEVTLAESGTVTHFTTKGRGRSVSFLPENYIALIPKSTIVPRFTQAASWIRKQHLEGRDVPSCINFITGPSNSADIELNLVVGVHGPVRAAYIVIDDL